jgi:hypothetical protein
MNAKSWAHALVAAPIGAVLGAIALTVFGLGGHDLTAAQAIGTVAALSVYGTLVAIPIVIVYGVPLYAALNRFGLANMFAALIFGAAPGVAWVIWTRGSWLDPILIDGTLIAVAYLLFRRRYP